MQNRFLVGARLQGLKLYLGKERSLQRLVVMSANRQANVEGILQFDAHGRPRWSESRAGLWQSQVKGIALPSDTNLWRTADIRLNFMSKPPRDVTKLQRGEPIAVHGYVDVGRTRVETLADHQAGFAMGVAPSRLPFDSRLQREISRNSLPHEVQRVIGEPHVLATARDDICPQGVDLCWACLADMPNVCLVFEKAQLGAERRN